MTDDIYQVDKEEYLGFLQTLKPECCIEANNKIDDWHYQIVESSKKSNQVFCKKIVTLDLEKKYVISERYYVINLPPAEESREPTGKLRIELKTPEELKAFFNLISKGAKKK